MDTSITPNGMELQNMTSKKQPADQRFGIGAVAKLTGLSDHTIRVWERRYAAVVAERAANGRREYTVEHVEKLGLLKRLTDAGIAISRIAGDDIDELRERAASMSVLAHGAAIESIGTAVLGQYLSSRLLAYGRDLAPLDLVVVDSDRDRFTADLEHHTPDVVVVEKPVLDGDAVDQLSELMQRCGARGGVLVFSFGATADIDRARQAGVVVLRAPADAEQLRAAVMQSVAAGSVANAAPAPRRELESAAEWRFSGPIAPRRFTDQQLARLANASTTIDCECPHHLAQLVRDLSAFEIYSAQCANRDDDDAALHRYLHQTSAEARSLIEVALERVARAEGLDY